MADFTVVHLMRHGEVDNPNGVLYGRLPGYHLTKLGQKMTKMSAEYLAQHYGQIDRIISSPLERAIESATPAAQIFQQEIHTDSRLLESANLFEGEIVNGNRLALAHPRNWWRYRNPFRPSWCESYQEQAKRMSEAVKSALAEQRALHQKARNQGEEPRIRRVLLVSHQLPIWCLRLFVEQKNLAHLPFSRECSLASLTSLTFQDSTLIDLDYAEPVKSLLAQASDMVPGRSEANLNQG